MKGRLLLLVAVTASLSGCMSHLYISKKPVYEDKPVKPISADLGTPIKAAPGNELATFSGGRFWDLESKFREVPGVVNATVGYTGGQTSEPNFRDVSTGTTGHTEAVVVEFDPKKVSYEQPLVKFFQIHDPTTKNRQGDDVGTQYRSAVFFHTIEQRNAAAAMIRKLRTETRQHVLTYVVSAKPFWAAESYYQQYLTKTGTLSSPDPNWRRDFLPPNVSSSSSSLSSRGTPPVAGGGMVGGSAPSSTPFQGSSAPVGGLR